jgi:hypothetical protein
MGSNIGNGIGGMDLNSALQGNGPNQPQATEYTLQGVMRFLQTEWHRHERDRNAWEIEKQEMKGRIANLEGQARRADATQKALKKYVSILERKIKDQAAQLKGADAAEAEEAAKNDRAARIQEKLRCRMPLLCPFPSWRYEVRNLVVADTQYQPRPRAKQCRASRASKSRGPTTRRSERSSRRSWTSASLSSCIS